MTTSTLNLEKIFNVSSFDITLTHIPWISQQTDTYHKIHLRNYIINSKKFLEEDLSREGIYQQCQSIEDIIKKSAELKKDSYFDLHTRIYKNVSQVFNHVVFFEQFGQNNGFSNNFKILIQDSFGSFQEMVNGFLEKAKELSPGYGYLWLCHDHHTKKLVIVNTIDAQCILVTHPKLQPIYTIDLWEHAFYTDYQNRSGEFIQNVLQETTNWSLVENRLARQSSLYQLQNEV